MGHATSWKDSVESVGAYERYILPALIRNNPEAALSIPDRAVKVAAELAIDRTLDDLRATMGDCAVGLCVAGIMHPDEAVRAAIEIHLDPLQQDRIAKFGGLFVGVEAGLISLQETTASGGSK
jgi:hypothetical protein